jgi:hypothetical protein
LALFTGACASSLPPRYVIEHDLDGYAYRRYQKSFDIEIPVADNAATGHTAAYLRRDADDVAVYTAFVTVYAHAASLAAEARDALARMPGYTLTPGELAGQSVWMLASNDPERFCVWPSGRYLVKLGAPKSAPFPDAIANAYASLYPSDLDEHGNARKGSASYGAAKSAQTEETEPPVPAGLREGAPR